MPDDQWIEVISVKNTWRLLTISLCIALYSDFHNFPDKSDNFLNIKKRETFLAKVVLKESDVLFHFFKQQKEKNYMR